jgi:hypothetical protein
MVSMAYNFPTGKNKIKLLTEYDSVTQKVFLREYWRMLNE